MGEIARSKSRIASDLKTRDSNRWRPCDLKLRFETRDWRFVLDIGIQQNCEKGCDLSQRSKIASDWRLAILPISVNVVVFVIFVVVIIVFSSLTSVLLALSTSCSPSC